MEVSQMRTAGIDKLDQLEVIEKLIHQGQDGYSILEITLRTDDALGAVINALTEQDIHILNLEKREPTLEDVFVELVGKSMAEVESQETNG